jgi:hypothetical protein
MQFRSTRRHAAATALGALLALALIDLALRGFATGLQNRWHAVSLAQDSIDGPVTEVRYYHEGMARSHFSAAHARLTAAPETSATTSGILLGDSYVEALQIPDSETTGAVVERLARINDVLLDVRQYGWSGASLSQYLKVAPEVLARWNPDWVAVMVNSDDLTPEAAMAPPLPFPPAAAPAAPPRVSGARALLEVGPRWLLEHSPLAYELMLSALELSMGGAPTSDGVHAPAKERIPDATDAVSSGAIRELELLQQAYGPRLVLVYVGQIPADPSVTTDPTERVFLQVCVERHVRCVGTADSMRKERDGNARLSRGFSNSRPGVGHPNATGHRLLGEALWREVKAAGAR